MAWTNPKTWVAAIVVTAAELNTHIRDNLNYLKSRADSVDDILDASVITTAAESGFSAEQVLGTDVVMAGTFAARPAFGTAGRLYFATDTFVLYRDTGAAWTQINGPYDAPYVTTAADGDLSGEQVLGTAVIMAGTLGARPAFGTAGRLYWATDDNGGTLYRDSGAAWVRLSIPLSLEAVNFLVGTATGLLSGEIAVGAAPGGELGGTWAAPTVDAMHSGSAHHARQHAMNAAADHSGNLDSASASLGADVSQAAAGTYYDGPSVSLGAGTWLVVACLSLLPGSSVSNQQVNESVKLWDGSTVWASAESGDYSGSTGGTRSISITVVAIITLGGTTTVKASAASVSGTNGKILAAMQDGGAGNNASTIAAVKLGP